MSERPQLKAVGRFDGIPLIVAPHKDGPTGFVYVPKEYVKPFRDLMKKEKLSSYDTQIEQPWKPRTADLRRVQQLYEAAQKLVLASASPSQRKPPKARPEPETPLEREAALLRALLLAGHADLELEPVKLKKNEPASIRTLWSTLGWDEELSSVIGWPDRTRSADELHAAMRDYASWGSPLERSKLPARFRLVHVDEQGVGVGFTDETGEADDPPVVFASSDTGELETVSPSYLRWVGTALVAHALAALPGFELLESALASTAGDTPLPTLAPNLRRPSSHVYVAKTPHANDRWRIATTDFGALVDTLASSPGTLVPTDTGSMLCTAQIEVPRFTPVDALVELRSGARLFAGRVDAVAMLIDGTRLHAAPADLERAKASAQARGWC